MNEQWVELIDERMNEWAVNEWMNEEIIIWMNEWWSEW